MRLVALIIGVILTLATLYGLVQAMLVPRNSSNYVARLIERIVTTTSHAPLRLMRTYRRQDRWLAGSAPITVFLQLIVYVVILIFTIGLVMYGLGGGSYGDSLYQSGSTFTTLGLVVPANSATIAVGFIAAFVGMVVIAVFIGYLLAIYAAFIARESTMARVSTVTGEPAWGVQILVRAHLLGLPDANAPLSMSWVDWITSVRLSQRVNPVLSALRSTASNRHWTTTALAVLDAAALRVSFHPDERGAGHIELLTTGAASFRVLAEVSQGREPGSGTWDMEQRLLRALEGTESGAVDCGVTRAEFDDGLDEIQAAGVDVPADRDAVWRRFSGIRHLYAPSLFHLAQRYHAVPAPWSGPRSPALEVIWPERAGLQQGD